MMPKVLATSPTLPVACFAPPMTDELLAKYSNLVDSLDPSPVRDAMAECLAPLKLWWALPESTRKDVERFNVRHKGKNGHFVVTPLEEEHVKQLWASVPWMYELQAMESILEALDPVSQKELRDAAHHLLWFAKELTLDREPLTQEKLP